MPRTTTLDSKEAYKRCCEGTELVALVECNKDRQLQEHARDEPAEKGWKQDSDARALFPLALHIDLRPLHSLFLIPQPHQRYSLEQ